MVKCRMGDLFAGPGFRACSHSGCRAPAVATLSFEYSSRQVWLDPLQPTSTPSTYDLCDTHAGRFSPPRGWDLADRREGDAPAQEPLPVAIIPESESLQVRSLPERRIPSIEGQGREESRKDDRSERPMPMVLPEII